ncbi:MAG TPA: MerR family DNA-binding transcriptional regulator [Candidatus Taylorbacteria bacterium]|nr:MerR family DNA-binding transcriptional regulator [Candidatus Taylorbacteria bacterium]
MNEELVTIKDAARMLGVSRLTLRNWDKSGKLLARRHPISNYRVYSVDDLKNLLAQIQIPKKPRPAEPRKLAVTHESD